MVGFRCPVRSKAQRLCHKGRAVRERVVAFFEGGKRVKTLVTGSSGLIGAAAVTHFDAHGHEVVGVGQQRAPGVFRGCRRHAVESGTAEGATKRFVLVELDIRDRAVIEQL